MEAEELGLGAILVDALPPTLFTDEAPERYTVSAVFTRRPTRSEIDAIHGSGTRDALRAAGYGAVDVRVSDRRLELANTNLEELTTGLAGVIAERLHVISMKSAADDQRKAAAVVAATQRETDRAALVALAAAAVVFRRPDDAGGATAQWEDEGGAPRQRYAAPEEPAPGWRSGSSTR